MCCWTWNHDVQSCHSFLHFVVTKQPGDLSRYCRIAIFFVYFSKFFFLDVSFTCMGFRVWGRHMEMAFQKMWEAARGGISKPEPCTSLNLGFFLCFSFASVASVASRNVNHWTATSNVSKVAQCDGYISELSFLRASPKRLIPGVVSRMASWTFNQPLWHQSNVAKCSSKRLFTSSEFKCLIFAGGGSIHLLSIAFWSRKTMKDYIEYLEFIRQLSRLTWDAEDLSTPQSFKDRTRLEGMAAREEQLGEDAHVSNVALMLQESKTCKGSVGHWCWESKRNVNGMWMAELDSEVLFAWLQDEAGAVMSFLASWLLISALGLWEDALGKNPRTLFIDLAHTCFVFFNFSVDNWRHQRSVRPALVR